MNVNLYSAIALTQQIRKNGGSEALRSIVNIASVMSVKPASFAADYSMSKHAFKAWNDALREELRTKGTKVSAIYPGSVNTSSWDGLEVDRTAMIQAEDIAEMVECVLRMRENTLLEEIHVSPITFQP
jgi:short-subunit dehydrogenase